MQIPNLMIEVDKSAAETEANAPDDDPRADDVSALPIPPLELQPGTGPRDAERYQLDELLRYHDRTFVAHAYAALRKRAPTAAELANALDDLRSGRRGKIEIIESLLTARSDGQPAIRVAGLPSPILRRVSRWPFVGYLLRMFGGFTRLPMLIQHQQQFEGYALAQQQNIADYLNEVLAPAVKRHEEDSPVIANLSVTLADAVDSVLMLSDSLVELSARHAEFQLQLQAQLEQLKTQQAQQAQTQTQVRVQLEQLQTQQAQEAQAETQLQASLGALTDAQTAQRHALEETQRAQAATAAAQQEFLIQEQRVIVETQKVVLGELQIQLDQLLAQQKQESAELASQVRSLQALVEATRPRAPGRAAGKRVGPKHQQA